MCILGCFNLSTIPENTFKSQTNLEELYLYSNNLSTLPEHIFKSQTKLVSLYLHKNKLSTLHISTIRDILKNWNMRYLPLNENPLLCDCGFSELVRQFKYREYLGEIVCVDGELVDQKLTHVNGTICPNLITNDTAQPWNGWCAEKFFGHTIILFPTSFYSIKRWSTTIKSFATMRILNLRNFKVKFYIHLL